MNAKLSARIRRQAASSPPSKRKMARLKKRKEASKPVSTITVTVKRTIHLDFPEVKT